MGLHRDSSFQLLAVLFFSVALLAIMLLLVQDPRGLVVALPLLALLVPAGAFCWRFAFSLHGGASVSLDGALLIPAVILASPSAALTIAALIALLGSAVRQPSTPPPGPFWKALMNMGILVLTTLTAVVVHAGLSPLPSDRLVPLLLRAALIFATLEVANLGLVSAALVARGVPARPYAAAALSRSIPVEATTIPVAAVTVQVWNREGFVPTLLIVASLVLAAVGLSRLEQLRRRNAALRRELLMRTAELDTLGVIGRQLATSPDPERLFDLVEREVCRLLTADVFVLALVDRDTQETEFVRVVRDGERVPGCRQALRPGTSRVIERGDGLLIRDVPSEPDIAEDAVLVDAAVRSLVAVPLLMDGQVTGLLSVQSYRAAVYGPRDEQLLRTVAQQAAVALENARHYLLATVDQLTRLYHREHFQRRLREEERRYRRYGGGLALLMLDLDDFGAVNNRYGHLAGDRLLRAVGEVVRASLRSADIPCRWGGEEICILLPETDADGALAMAERICREVRGIKVEHEGRTVLTTASIGVAATRPGEDPSMTALLRRADQALYEAKRRGKDQAVRLGGVF